MRELVMMLNPWGAGVIERLQAVDLPVLDAVFRAITHAGDGYYVLVALVLYWCLDRPRGVQLVALYAVSLAANALLKALIANPRPFVAYPQVIAKVSASGFSFPSGHAQMAAAFGVGAAWLYRRGWVSVVAAVVALLIALSRVWLGVHYPHDVAAGLLLGLGTVLVYAWVRRGLLRSGVDPGLGGCFALTLLVGLLLAVTLDAEYAHLAAGGWMGFGAGSLVAERSLPETRAPRPRVGWLRAALGLAMVIPVGVAALVSPALREYVGRNVVVGALGACALGLLVAWFAPWLFERLGLGSGQDAVH